jgi:outer membrane protein, multidrug efflux system
MCSEPIPLRGERADLAALDDRIGALRATRTSIAAGALPVVGLYGAFAGSDQDNLVDSDWIEGGVRLDWAPVAGGTRSARIAAARQRIAAFEAQRDQLRLGIEVEVRAAAAALEVAAAEIDVRRRAVRQAELAREQLVDRYGQGLATLTDLLQVEAELRAQRTRLRVAEVEVVRASLRRKASLGG